MKLIVGLGNPGKEYEHTRHNTGFLVLDILKKKLGFSAFRNKLKLFAEISEGASENSGGEAGGEKIILAKPQTFMNNSGKAVLALMKFYKIHPQDLWIIYDDVDLIEGTFRIRKQGSAGTHNGMKSIVSALGHGNFPRFRMGVAKENMSKDIVKFILNPLTGKAWKCFEDPLNAISEVMAFALKEGLEKAMNRYN